MGSGDVCGVLCILCSFTFPPFVLQAVGFFTPMWGSNSTCDSIGLLYSCCAGNDNATCKNTYGGDELDALALGLHATSFAVMFLTVILLCLGGCRDCSKDDEWGTAWCSILGFLCACLYPVAGVFSFIGCIIVATKFSTSELGYSFYLCLTAGCILLLVLLIIGGYLLYKKLEKCTCDACPEKPRSTISPPSRRFEGRSSVTPYAGGGGKGVIPYAGHVGSSVTPKADNGGSSVIPYAAPGGSSVTPYAGRDGSSVTPYAGRDGSSVTPYAGRGGSSVTPYAGHDGSSVTPYAGRGGVAPYEPRQQEVRVEAQHARVEQAVGVHDRESGLFYIFLRKINITKLAATMKHN